MKYIYSMGAGRMLIVMMKEAISLTSICCLSMLWFEYFFKKSSLYTKAFWNEIQGKTSTPALWSHTPQFFLFVFFLFHAADVVCSCNIEIYAKAIYIRNEAYNTLFFILHSFFCIFCSFALLCCLSFTENKK